MRYVLSYIIWGGETLPSSSPPHTFLLVMIPTALRVGTAGAANKAHALLALGIKHIFQVLLLMKQNAHSNRALNLPEKMERELLTFITTRQIFFVFPYNFVTM